MTIKGKQLQAVKGMHDILPEDQKYWRYIGKKSETLLEDYSFEKIETPIVEATELFARGVGETTDIVEKEMYSFKTKGGDDLTLRPEGTAPVVRAYLEHGMNVRPQPVKLYYVSQMFRHEQPQSGRYRQFWQLGLETIGDDSEAVDAELIFLGYKLLDSFGIKDYVVQINSIGDQNCRPAYLRALRDYYRSRLKRVCANCKLRFKNNILRMLDCKEPECYKVKKDAPQMMDFLDEDCKLHFRHVLEFLDEAKVPYSLNPHLVRGLDYYTRTVFEFLPDDLAKPQLAIVSGGRYDKLVELLGGHKTPAAGWAMGFERVIAVLKEKDTSIPETKIRPKVFLCQLGDAAKRKSLLLFEELRRAGIDTKSSISRDSIKSQLRMANRYGARFALIFGQKEALEESIILKEMDTGIQETIPLEKIVEEIKKRLKK